MQSLVKCQTTMTWLLQILIKTAFLCYISITVQSMMCEVIIQSNNDDMQYTNFPHIQFDHHAKFDLQFLMQMSEVPKIWGMLGPTPHNLMGLADSQKHTPPHVLLYQIWLVSVIPCWSRQGVQKNWRCWDPVALRWGFSDLLYILPSPTSVITANLVTAGQTVGAQLQRASGKV